ncbi:MAG: hypothetical protein M1827_005864 [Pycnora praestabilis]|nr:MAG: hypothetical protein M1827_005864 [Pycnora praestabilis]
MSSNTILSADPSLLCHRSAWLAPGTPQGLTLDLHALCWSTGRTQLHVHGAWSVPGAPQVFIGPQMYNKRTTTILSSDSSWRTLRTDPPPVSEDSFKANGASYHITNNLSTARDDADDEKGTKFAEYLVGLGNLARKEQDMDVSYPSEEQLDVEFGGKVRRTNINIYGLMTHAASLMGKACCNSISVLGCGTFNKVFTLDFTDHTEILARIKYDRTSVDMEVMESEVATIAFLQKHRPNIPTPKILHWDSSHDNPSGRPFMLVKKLAGLKVIDLPFFKHMSKRIPGGSADSKVTTILNNIAKMHAELVRPLPYGGANGLPAPQIGQLRLMKESWGYRAGTCDSETPVKIGPFVSSNYNTHRTLDHYRQGPFDSLWNWFDGLEERSRRQLWIEAMPDPERKFARRNTRPHVEKSENVNERVACQIDLAAILSVEGRKRTLPLHPAHEESCLWHTDLGLYNILCDPETLEITGVLDWEDAMILPLVFAASTSPSLIPWFKRSTNTTLTRSPHTSDYAYGTAALSTPSKNTKCLHGKPVTYTGSRFYGLGVDVDTTAPAFGADWNALDILTVELTWMRRWYRMMLAKQDPRFGSRIWEEHAMFYRMWMCLKNPIWLTVNNRTWIREMADKAMGMDGSDRKVELLSVGISDLSAGRNEDKHTGVHDQEDEPWRRHKGPIKPNTTTTSSVHYSVGNKQDDEGKGPRTWSRNGLGNWHRPHFREDPRHIRQSTLVKSDEKGDKRVERDEGRLWCE